VCLALAGVACSTSKRDTPCPRNEPAFHLQLTAADGVLPADVKLVVGYSGTVSETYSLTKGGPGNQYVCCRAGSPVKGNLPDVACGLPPPDAAMSVPTPHDASVTRDASALHDASTLHDASMLLRDAALLHDAAPSRDAALSHDAALIHDAEPIHDAAVSLPPADASPPLVDAGRPDAAPVPKTPSGPTAILCDLWTNGGATITVTGTGYPALHTDLDAFVRDPRCGVETIDERVILVHSDAGL
jgi:hypothetical protein